MSPECLTDRLRARPPQPSDEPGYLALFLDPEVSAWLRPDPLPPFSATDVRDMLRDDIRHWELLSAPGR